MDYPEFELDFYSDLQAEIRAWHLKNFPEEDGIRNALSICEESGEVARAYSKQAAGIRGTWDHWQSEKAKEFGDVMISVINACAHEGFSWEDVLMQRWATISMRDFTVHPVDGGREQEELNFETFCLRQTGHEGPCNGLPRPDCKVYQS